MAAARLFEKENGKSLDEFDNQAIESTGLMDIDPSNAVLQVKVFLEQVEAGNPLTGTAIFALGKRFDPGLKVFFIKMLRKILDINSHAVYQTLIALNNLDEKRKEKNE